MGQKDTPWGAEEIIIKTGIKVEKDFGNLVVKKTVLDSSEITELERHRSANVVLYVLKGAVNIRVDEDFYELEKGESHYIESNLPHQIENLDDDVTEVLKIIFPFEKGDIDILENPYED